MKNTSFSNRVTRRVFLTNASTTVLGMLAASHLASAIGIDATANSPKNTTSMNSTDTVTRLHSREDVRALFAFDSSVDPKKFASHCSEWGIRQAILPPSFFSTDKFATALTKEDIGLWLNFPVFYNPGYLERHPEHYAITNLGRRAIHDWCHFVCPSRPEYIETFLQELRGLLTKYSPQIVSLDFIRHYVFWEAVDLTGPSDSIEDGCYCGACLRAFEKFIGEKLPNEHAANHIRRNLKRQWGDWKCSQITGVADQLFAEIRKLAPNARYTIKTVPWKRMDLDDAIRSSAGQDIPALGKNCDFICPMAFVQILGQTPQWKRDLLNYVRQITGKPVLSYLQTDKVIRASEITVRQFEAELKESLSQKWAGTAIFEYGQLAANLAKAAILQSYLKR